jgi:hypothetical protein
MTGRDTMIPQTRAIRDAIRAERNDRPDIRRHRSCLDCTEPESARCHRLPARDIWDAPQHDYVPPMAR